MLLAWVLLTFQFLGLIVYSAFEFRRFSLGIDFAVYHQGLAQIAGGHLAPTLTVFGYPFLRSHFELIIWPLSLLYLVFRTSFVLLVVQDASLVGTGIVVYLWITRLVRARRLPAKVASLILVASLTMILVDPLVYYTAAIDFHLEATATFFAVLASYWIWMSKYRRAALAVVLCLLCGDIGGLYVIGIGLSALLAGRSTRRVGLLLLLIGLGWTGGISALGANKGSVTYEYAYLAGRQTLPAGVAGLVALGWGVIAHPGRPLRLLRGRVATIGRYLLPGGVLGLVNPWGLGVPAAVLATSSLMHTTLFISGEPYQQFAVAPFVLFGTASLFAVLLDTRSPAPLAHKAHRAGRNLLYGFLAVAVVGGALSYADRRLPRALTTNATSTFPSASEARILNSVLGRIPTSSEVISSEPIMGRFGGRRYIYAFDSTVTSIPIDTNSVVLVMDTAHPVGLLNPGQEIAAAHYVTATFHARTLAHDRDVWALQWTVSTTPTSIVLP